MASFVSFQHIFKKQALASKKPPGAQTPSNLNRREEMASCVSFRHILKKSKSHQTTSNKPSGAQIPSI